jgi:citrate lyase gamma subunit
MSKIRVDPGTPTVGIEDNWVLKHLTISPVHEQFGGHMEKAVRETLRMTRI